MPTRRVMAAVALALSLLAFSFLAAGCGGGGSDASEKAAVSTVPDAGGSTAPHFSGAGSARFCELTRSYNERFTQLAGTLSGSSTETQVAQFVQELAAAISEARDVAPAEIHADVALLADAVNEFASSLRAAGYDFSKVPPDAGSKLQSPEVQAASERVEAYDRQACEAG